MKEINEIICPNCKKAFKVDEAGYADILKQVRDQKFDEDLQNRLDTLIKRPSKIFCKKKTRGRNR